jgi:threo-3-hydroxy-L-aspartate ammonia-lyase
VTTGDLVTPEDAFAAAERISPDAVATPMVTVTRQLSLKAECLQSTGSFKFRGACNAVREAVERGLEGGVVADSSGNHGYGVARAANLAGIPATVVMPGHASPTKRRNVAGEGAVVMSGGPTSQECFAAARRLAAERGLLHIPSTEDRRVIAGQATVGVEIARFWKSAEARALPAAEGTGGSGLRVLVPVGGGGLAGGVGAVVKVLLPGAEVIGVEPALAADARESLRRGRIVRWAPERATRTIADGMRNTSLGPIGFEHLRAFVDRIVTVGEDAIGQAMRWLSEETGMPAEPSGAVATAAHLSGAVGDPGARHTICVVSGANGTREADLVSCRAGDARIFLVPGGFEAI